MEWWMSCAISHATIARHQVLPQVRPRYGYHPLLLPKVASMKFTVEGPIAAAPIFGGPCNRAGPMGVD